MTKGIFITATGTEVGKTYVTALMVKKMRESGFQCGYYKVAMSGNERTQEGLIPGDAKYVNDIANLDEPLDNLVSYVYEEAVSPHLAAKLEGKPVDLAVVTKDYAATCEKYDYVAVEGSGGIVCPIRWDEQQLLLEDIVQHLQLSTIVVADAGLGTINSVVLTVSYLQQKGIGTKGIILNHYDTKDIMKVDNKAMIEQLTNVPVIACVQSDATDLDINLEHLAALFA